MSRFLFLIVPAAAALVLLSACGGNDSAREVRARYEPVQLDSDQPLGVNGYLWRATMDTLSFMALKSTDSQGGAIVTEWYVDPDAQNERFSVTARILDRALRADALEVTVHRQVFDKARGWVSAPARQETAAKLEEAILTRARQIRIGTVVNAD